MTSMTDFSKAICISCKDERILNNQGLCHSCKGKVKCECGRYKLKVSKNCHFCNVLVIKTWK